MAESDHRKHGRWLRDLMEEVIDVHKGDISELTSGHLNESKLWNPSNENRESWPSATKPALRLKKTSKLEDHSGRKDCLPPIERNNKHMTETVMDFMIGPSGGIGYSDRQRYTHPTSQSNESSFIDKEKKIPSDSYFIQELELPQLMLPIQRRTSQESNIGTLGVRYAFMAPYHSMPTKVDQLQKMREFEGHTIKKTDVGKSKLLIGTKELAVVESKLRKRLANLEARHIAMGVPSFYKLQAYSDCWNDVIKQSRIFGTALQMIKDEYDKYISLLLDLQEVQNDGLLGKIDLLSEQATSLAENVRKEQTEIDDLEEQAMELLNENERLRKEKVEHKRLKEQGSKFTLPDRATIDKKSHRSSEKKKTLEEQVGDLRAQIENQLKILEELKTERREKYVPVIVCQRLENCIKETELEIQKLLKQNDFLEKKIDNMEEDLEVLLEESGTNDRDARMLWMKINTSKFVDSRSKLDVS